MDTFTIVVYLISNFVVMLAIERIMGVFFEKRRTPFVVMALSYLLYFVLTSSAFLLWNTPIISSITNLTVLLVITLNYESSTKKRIISTVGTFVILSTTDVIVAFSTGFYQVDVFDTAGVDNIFTFIIWGATVYILALLLRRFKHIRKSAISSPKFWIFYLSILVTSIVVLHIGLMYLPQGLGIIFIIMILGINLFMYYIHDILSAAYKDKLKSALHTQEKEYYFTQCQLMQESVERVKTIRHDMKLHLTTAADYNASGKVNELADYLRGLLGDINTSEVYSDTGNIAFDSIINFKLKTAAENNIKVDIDVLVPPSLNIEVADVVTILGNLLDNALDAVAKVEDKIIKLNIEASKGNLFIEVDNTFDGEVKYAKGKDSIAEAISTRKSGDNHGYGLKNICKAAEKYNGHVDISHDDNVFSVKILLYVEGM